MNKDEYERILKVMEDEREMELQCAVKCKSFSKNTLNPIRKLRCLFFKERCLNHVVGIDMAIRKFKQAAENDLVVP